jgi:hypothetical protein
MDDQNLVSTNTLAFQAETVGYSNPLFIRSPSVPSAHGFSVAGKDEAAFG